MSLRIVAISDTHSFNEKVGNIPGGDVLIHAGDMTGRGTAKDAIAAYEWLSSLPHPRIIVTPGNHDAIFQESPSIVNYLKEQFPRVETLIDRSTDLDGLRVYGSPWQPYFRNWSFNFPPGASGEIKAIETWDRIPDDTAILITHGPMAGTLDRTLGFHHVGCPALRDRIAKLSQLRLHIFGHIHEDYGTDRIGDVLHVNAATCDAHYNPTNPPIVICWNDLTAQVVLNV